MANGIEGKGGQGEKLSLEKGLSGERGFTLTELMVVVAIMMITAAVALPSYISDLPRQKAKAAASGLVSDIRFARSKAVADHTPVLICFDDTGASDHSYSIGREVVGEEGDCTKDTLKEIFFSTLHDGVVFGRGNTNLVCPGAVEGAGGVQFPAKTARFSLRGASINGSNLIQTSSAVYLTNPKDPDRANYCIQVEGTTGRARMYRWDMGEWK